MALPPPWKIVPFIAYLNDPNLTMAFVSYWASITDQVPWTQTGRRGLCEEVLEESSGQREKLNFDVVSGWEGSCCP